MTARATLMEGKHLFTGDLLRDVIDSEYILNEKRMQAERELLRSALPMRGELSGRLVSGRKWGYSCRENTSRRSNGADTIP